MRTPPASSPAPTDSLIPPPATKFGRSYIGYIQPEDRETFEEAKVLMRELLPKELNIKRSWSLQKAQATERLVDHVVEYYPVFRKYEDAWPVMYYCYQRLGCLRRPLVKRTNSGQRQKSPVAMVQACYDRHMNLRPRTRNAPANAQPILKRPQQALRNPAATLAYERVGRGEQDVLDFLMALDGNLAGLLDRFRFAGIIDKGRLRSLAQWPTIEKDLFLARDLGLNAFERRMRYYRARLLLERRVGTSMFKLTSHSITLPGNLLCGILVGRGEQRSEDHLPTVRDAMESWSIHHRRPYIADSLELIVVPEDHSGAPWMVWQ
ncbi:hypothetical protein C8Q78DRAFT_987358 [Trametes maxima]|nr:hypothetical protein C8Q78DRAFT_987358 [Trametes maxima]